MGCVSSKDTEISSPNQLFLRNGKLDDLVYQPLFSNLFNMLRKKTDIQIIRSNKLHPLFGEQLELERIAGTNDMKMLCNFKNVLIVGDLEIATQVKKASNPKAIYLLSMERAEQFLSIFPIFRHGQPRLQPRYVPIAALYQQQLACNRQNKQKSKIIFLHSQKYQNQQLYSQLKINHIVKQEPGTVNNNSVLVSKLANPGHDRVLFLHASDTKQEKLLTLLVEYLGKEYSLGEGASRAYFQQILPQAKHHQLQVLPKSQYILPANQSKISNTQKSLTQTLQQTLTHLYTEMGSDEAASQKLQRSYNLLINLLTNIYVNKQSQNFRRVKKINKQINQSLGRYQYGVKLLEDVGWVDEDGFYVNNMDVRYLKIYRTDLDLAYKKYNQGRKGK